MEPKDKDKNKDKNTSKDQDIRDDVKGLKDAIKDQTELLAKLIADQKEDKKEDLKSKDSKKDNKKEPVRRLELVDSRSRDVKNIKQIMILPSRYLNDQEKELRDFADDIYIMAQVLETDPRNLKMWQRFQDSSSALKKAMDTATAGEGSEWVPTTLSTNLIERYRLIARVPALFDEFPMPANPWTLPTSLADMTFYYMPESTSDEPTKTPSTKLTTGDLTMTAKKFRARSIWSEELNEESIIAVLPRIKENIARSAARAVEDAIINADTTATHQDSDVTNSKDHRKVWKGLRKNAIEQSYSADLSTFDKDTTLARITAMGKYGINVDDLAWIASTVSYNKLRGLAELRTVDKYGPNATILTGEVGKLYGIPVIVSEKLRNDMNNSGVYDGSTTDKTGILLVNTRMFALGNRGDWRLTVKFDDDVDQYIMNVRFKKAFIPLDDVSSEHIVEYGYKIS